MLLETLWFGFDSDDLMLPNALQDRLEKIGDLDFAAFAGSVLKVWKEIQD